MTYQEALTKALVNQDKAEAYRLTRAFLNEDAGNLGRFYETIIPGILNAIDCAEGDYECVFKEHRMSAMIRALVEMSHEYVVKQTKCLKPKRTVLIACMKDETHELGAVIGTHMFELNGFDTVFTGANTPLATIEAGMRAVHCDYLVLSVTNAYNLLVMNRAIRQLKNAHPDVKIFGAGRGVVKNIDRLELDGIMQSQADIERLIGEEGLTCSPSA